MRREAFRIVKNFEPNDGTPIIDLILKEAEEQSGVQIRGDDSPEGRNLLNLAMITAGFGFALGYVFGQTYDVGSEGARSQLVELKQSLKNSHLMRSLSPRLKKVGSASEDNGDLFRIGETNPTLMDYKDNFLRYCLQRRSFSENTVRGYEFDLRQYFEWLEKNERQITSISVRDLDAYVIWLKEKGFAATSVNRRISCIKAFYRWLLRMEVVNKNPLEAFDCLKQPKILPRYLSKDEQERLIEAARKGNGEVKWVRDRNYLMTLLLLDSGLRIGELCGLEMKNLNLKDGILRVFGKGSKEREVILSDRVLQAMKAFLKNVEKVEFTGNHVGPGLASRGFKLETVAKALGFSHQKAWGAVRGKGRPTLQKIQTFIRERVQPLPIRILFFNKNGKALGTRHAFRIIKELGEKAGVQGLFPHALRHTFATNLRERGADLLLTKEALGHASVITTQIYAHIGNEKRMQELKRLINPN
jgi:integrase/recombinase XerD